MNGDGVMSNLVIVESPTKAKTIKEYLGEGYNVVASMGHVIDLPKSKLGVDIENDFTPQYIPIKGKEELLKNLKDQASKSEKVFLATDPDREGEAISWHLSKLLDLDDAEKNRVAFNEITRKGIQNGMSAPRTIDMDLVNAQQTRRILDRIVGYKLSPFLWKKVRRGLSAGRVQSVAVRLIVDREQEIRSFKEEEYWTVDASLQGSESRRAFAAKLFSKGSEKLEILDGETAKAIIDDLSHNDFRVDKIKKSVRRRQPAPPFTTSTLQQDASKRLNFQSRRTMKVAQELYEGVNIPGYGSVGLITYMRTDSLRISDEAAQTAQKYIQSAFGKNYLPPSRKVYKSKSGAQDAHEAIRPSMPQLTPDMVAESLTSEQHKLYKLIWERFIASQMANALLDTASVDITAGDYVFKASGHTVKFDGFMKLYVESRDDPENKDQALPELSEGEILKVRSLDANQHFTQPPARYTEAALIKALEENGIGRPSTYAPTITTILSREYVEREGKVLKPTSLGEVTTKLMKEQFKNIVDVAFTAKMEKDLDRISVGEKEWKSTLKDFYTGFADNLAVAEKNLEGKNMKVPDEPTDVKCELCGRNMVIKMGRFGKFLACPGFPECKNTKKIVKDTGGVCPKCGKRVVAKKSKKGKPYYGCENNPSCDFMTWDTPLKETCPKCGSTLFKKSGRAGKKVCLKENCGYVRD